jgi:hypothetical protein
MPLSVEPRSRSDQQLPLLGHGEAEILAPGAGLVNPHPPARQKEKRLSVLIQGNGFPRFEEARETRRSTFSGGIGSRMSTLASRRSSSFSGASSITARI